ncbi:MAG: hypothetical protein PUP92_37670 [Rhizonema sp. PD38]|nr:hypothetical protein [Rhizonema sp. PD38]
MTSTKGVGYQYFIAYDTQPYLVATKRTNYPRHDKTASLLQTFSSCLLPSRCKITYLISLRPWRLGGF